MWIDPHSQSRLVIAVDAPQAAANRAGLARYVEAVMSGETDLETLTDLVEGTRCIPVMRTFMNTVPGADRERISNMIAVVEVMDS